ncbi:MAG TPA: helix-turn-helix transcriptional regulator [Armatimonadota bacterium]|nr:helix-turn-helix transcriptional regulator [Armatimonadota bacterium]
MSSQGIHPMIESDGCQDLSWQLRRLRGELGIMQEDLAARSRTALRTIKRYEHPDYRGQKIIVSERIAKALGKRLVVTIEDETP